MAFNHQSQRQVACKIVRVCSVAQISADVKKNGSDFTCDEEVITILRDFDTQAAEFVALEIEILRGLCHVSSLMISC